MKRYLRVVASAAIMAGGLVSAGCANDCASRGIPTLEDRYRNAWDVAWPDRYNYAAREPVTGAFGQQAANGHFLEQTLWNWYFVPGTDKLTAGGLDRLDVICRTTPAADPHLYLQTARDIVMSEWFKLTDQSLEALRKEKLPNALLMKLAALKNTAIRDGDFRTEINEIFKALDMDEKSKLKGEDKDKYLYLILKYSAMTPETVAAFREELNARRAAAIKAYMTSQPGAPVAYEIAVHDAPVPGILAQFATAAYNGQKGGYRGGITGGGGANGGASTGGVPGLAGSTSSTPPATPANAPAGGLTPGTTPGAAGTAPGAAPTTAPAPTTGTGF
jgi:hypothetical protein